MSDSDLSSLGVDDKVLNEVALTLPELPSSEEDDVDRFLRQIYSLGERRVQEHWPNEANGDIGVFVLTPYPHDATKQYEERERALDLVAAQTAILGKVFYLNRDASKGFSIPLPCEPAAILDWLAASGLETPAVAIIYRGTKTLMLRRGLEAAPVEYLMREEPVTVSIEQLEKCLDYFHRTRVLTPKHCVAGLWETKRSSEYVPGPSPEKSIQRELAVNVRFWFHGKIVAKEEDSTGIGNIDVSLLAATDRLTYWAIIELKVIRTCHNAPLPKKANGVTLAANAANVADGLIQVHAYSENRKAPEALLEVFDLRKNKSVDIMAHEKVVEALKVVKPTIRSQVRKVFGNPKDARSAGYTG